MYNLSEGLILVYDDQEQTLNEKGLSIKVLPVWKWLLAEPEKRSQNAS